MQVKYKIVGNLLKAKTFWFFCFFACVTAICAIFLYKQTENILEDRLKEQLISIVSTASIEFDANQIKEIIKNGPKAVGTRNYQDVVSILQDIRNVNKNIYYAYILKPTSDSKIYTFIADADSEDPTAIIDLNKDGNIDDQDALNTPGDEFDASEIPALRNGLLNFSTTDESPVGDQWGLFLSAYAPLRDKGETIAVIGIDVEVTDYFDLISQTFIPFLIFIAFLMIVLAAQAIIIIKIGKRQILIVQELDRQKDELLGLVSHQLATPVSSIKWYLEMLQEGDLGELNEDQIEHVKTMRGIGENMSDLVSMILDVSRIQLGRIKVEKQDLNLDDFFNEIIAIIEPKAFEKKIMFNKNIAKKLPTAKLDRRYTNMTVENLLSNAVKYTPEGGSVNFDVNIKNGSLFIVVKDTGIGIPKSEQKKIFTRMFRATNARNTIDGNGFGLFVAKAAVEAQGGDIRFESVEGSGTTFYVQLPL